MGYLAFPILNSELGTLLRTERRSDLRRFYAPRPITNSPSAVNGSGALGPIATFMPWTFVHEVWPAMLLLAYVLVACSLRTLARSIDRDVEIHDLLRQTIEAKRRYLERLPPDERQRLLNKNPQNEDPFADEAERLLRLQEAAESQRRRLEGRK